VDHLIRGTALDGKVRAFAVNTTNLVAELQRRHDTWPTATAAMGRTVAAAAMMGAMLKGEERLTVQVNGGGPIGKIVVDANAKGEVRSYVTNPHTDLPANAEGKFDVMGAVGRDGYINVTKDLGLKEPYSSNSEIISGELGEDFTYYFTVSEQTPSAVAVGVLIDTDYSIRAAGGLILQLLPGLTDQEITEIEFFLSRMRPFTEMLDHGMTLEEIVQFLLPSFQTMEKMDITFKCNCSRERVESTLLSLPVDDLKDLEADGHAEVVCHFCNEQYQFGKEELTQFVAQKSEN
jgi:molecular chaperone Hsp33